MELDVKGSSIVLEQNGTGIDDDEVLLDPEVTSKVALLLTRATRGNRCLYQPLLLRPRVLVHHPSQ